MVAYSLGKNPEQNTQDVLVLGENEQNVITYSRSNVINLYGYQEKKYTSLKIPYSTIKQCKVARQHGVREIVYEVFHRPDKSPLLRSCLDVWGFESYDHYLYTICELGFLEGLIPVIDLGFLTPDELEKLNEVVAVTKVLFFSDYDHIMDQHKIRSFQRSYDIKLKLLNWASKLSFPISVGLFISDNIDLVEFRDVLSVIKDHINQYDSIHDIFLTRQNRMKDLDIKIANEKKMIRCYSIAKDIIGENVPISIKHPSIDEIDVLMSHNERDLGSFDKYIFEESIDGGYWNDIQKYMASKNLVLQQRFPLRRSFIESQRYSKKLGQVFDPYRYKIKKEKLEKQKENK